MKPELNQPIATISIPRLQCHLQALGCACVILALMTGCASSDPEYSQKLAMAGKSWHGDELKGIWVSKMSTVGVKQRRTLLVRTDGTGVLRLKSDFGIEEWALSLHYQGGGLWTGAITKPGRSLPVDIHYTGGELLYHINPVVDIYAVFVRAENEMAVDEYLKKR